MKSSRPKVLVMGGRRQWVSVGLVLLALVVFLAMPWWARRNTMHLAVEFFYLAGLAGMWNLLAGYGGLVSIGQQAYVGIGGYSVVAFALLMGANPFVSIFLAASPRRSSPFPQRS